METESPVIFEWSVHPLREGGFRLLLFMLSVTVFPLLVGVAFESIIWASFAELFLLGTLSAYWLPTRFRLTEQTAELQRWFWNRKKLYRDFGRIEKDPNGLFLAPFTKPSRLDGYRGMLLLSPPEPDRLLEFLKQKVGTGA